MMNFLTNVSCHLRQLHNFINVLFALRLRAFYELKIKWQNIVFEVIGWLHNALKRTKLSIYWSNYCNLNLKLWRGTDRQWRKPFFRAVTLWVTDMTFLIIGAIIMEVEVSYHGTQVSQNYLRGSTVEHSIGRSCSDGMIVTLPLRWQTTVGGRTRCG